MKGRAPTDILTMQTLENKARTQTMKSIPRPPTLTNIQTGLSFGTIPNILGQKGSPITQSPVGMQNLRMNFVAPETQPAPENANREDDSNYEDWLEQGPHVNKGEQPTSGCRLILTRRPQFGLAALVPMLIQFISRLVNGTDQGSSCSVISFNPDTNITYGMVMGLYSDEQIQTHGTNLVMWETHMFHERTLHSIKWTWHPVAHAIIQIDETLRFFQIIARLASIRVVEMSHSAGIMQMTTSGEMVPLAEALARDYTTDTASLAMQSAQMAMCQTALESNMAILEDLIETIAEIESIAPSTKEIRPYLMAEINNLKSRCNSSTLYAQGIQRNISFTQTAIYNLIAQRDSKVNIELAKDSRMLAIASKRDSSSMKTIAVLTIVFLPGTFVSALFAMPVLNWEAKSYPEVTTDKFWVYWAVTLPMTLLVILTWIVWTKRQSWLNRKDHEEGMKTYDEVDVEKAMMESKDPEKIPLKADFEGGNTAGGVDSRRHRWFSMGSKSEGRKRHHGD
ncbi:hypothetical protein TWF192_006447 [Orbilia oligospora]|nr:hypothetical protein TWF192_006447 [Orbilia oligospora]